MTDPKTIRKLSAADVRRCCDPFELGFETTSDALALEGVVGQQRALGALEFSAGMTAEGFNLYVLGEAGSQRHELVYNFLKQQSAGRETPPDWCYVHNFDDPQKPVGLKLPTGTGARLRADMAQLVDDLRASVPAAFESETYRSRRAEIEQEFHDRHRQGLEAIQQESESEQLGWIPTPHGFAIAPVRNGQVLDQDEFNALPEAERKRTEAAVARLSERLKQHLAQLPAWHKDRRAMIKDLDRQITMLAVGSLIDSVRQQYSSYSVISPIWMPCNTMSSKVPRCFWATRTASRHIRRSQWTDSPTSGAMRSTSR